MNGNCHFIYAGAVTGMIALNIDKLPLGMENNSTTATLLILGGLIGGILPDIDNPNSYMGKLSVPVSTVIAKIGESFGKKGKYHRGIFHDPFIYILGLVLSYLFMKPLIGLFIGCLTHVFLDMFNPVGVPFMLGTKHLHLGKIYSGSKESVVFTWINVALVLCIGIGCFLFIY